MLNQRRRTCALALLTALTAAGCGFQLRGSGGQALLPFQTIYPGFGETSSLGAELKRYIRSSGDTTVVDDPKQAQVILDILGEVREKKVLSLNAQGRVREYTLYYRLNFRARDNANKVLIPPTEIVLKRDISFNESQVMAKESEEEMLYRDMQSDMVQQLLRRLGAIKLN